MSGNARAFRTHELPEATELRVGTYVDGDGACVSDGTATLDVCALRAAVASRPTSDRAILDAGSKTPTSDRAAGCEPNSMGLLVEYPEARVARLYKEHAVVELRDATGEPDVGDDVTLIPNHACEVVHLENHMEAHRGGVSIGTWAIGPRGRRR